MLFRKIQINGNANQTKYGVKKAAEIIARKKNDIEMYSTHNKGKSVAAEIFIRTLKNKT